MLLNTVDPGLKIAGVTGQGVISMITLAGLIWYKSKGYGGPTVIWSLKAVSQYGRHTLIREGKARTVEGS